MTKQDDEREVLKDENGNPMTTADGTPLYHDYFTNDINMDDWEENYESRSDREVFEEMIELGLDVPEEVLREKGFVMVDGKWVYKEPESK